MLRAAIASLAGTLIARDAAKGNIPEGLSAPLMLLATRLPAPALILGAIGYGIYRYNVEQRANQAKDVTPRPRKKRAGSAVKKKPASSRKRAPRTT